MLPVTYYLMLYQKGQDWKVNHSTDPAFDRRWGLKNGYTQIWCWDRPFPLWLAERLQEEFSLLRGKGKAGFSLRRLRKELSKTTTRYGWSREGTWVRLGEEAFGFSPLPLAVATEEHGRQVRTELEKILLGRALTPKELRLALGQCAGGTSEYLLNLELQALVLEGKVERVAGVGLDKIGRFFCRRCGEQEGILVEKLSVAAHPCRVCPTCRNFGLLTDGVPLYRWRGERPRVKLNGALPPLVLPSLTIWQERAVKEALEFWRKPKTRTLLVWAVCGAGKTEVIFPVIREALARGQRVLLAVPRREIVRELGERIKRCFPGLAFTLLYGGHQEVSPDSLLVVATTHQLLRFTSFFDLAIIDEVDAFPLYGNPMLNAALERVILPTGKKIYLTATPDASWRRRAQRGEIDVAKIPLRYHGHLLPVPHLVRTALPTEKAEFIPEIVVDFLQTLVERKRKGLIFLPTVETVEAFARKLKGQYPAQAALVDQIHARDPKRDDKVKRFASGSLRLLVTTTLLERGLNFDRLDLMILHADTERIFSTETLIQIAGRVGRKADDPGGAVYFVAERISPTMKAARQAILEMNKEGEKERTDLVLKKNEIGPINKKEYSSYVTRIM